MSISTPAGAVPVSPSHRSSASAPSPQSSSSPAPAATGGGRVASLNLRREGSRVLADLDCLICDGIGSVEINVGTAHSASIDPPSGEEVSCGACEGKGKRTLESTEPDFTAAWSEQSYGFTEAERVEANRLLEKLEDEAQEACYARMGRAS